jgi:hypothetical protein
MDGSDFFLMSKVIVAVQPLPDRSSAKDRAEQKFPLFSEIGPWATGTFARWATIAADHQCRSYFRTVDNSKRVVRIPAWTTAI